MFDKSHCKPDRRIRKSKGYTKHQGYVMVHKPSHPNSWKNGYIKLHRLVMECEKGRYLNRDEHVHHKDFNKENNHPSNLEITTMSRHTTTHNYETKKYTSKWDVSEIKKLYEQGDTIREIEKKTGMSKSNVSQYIKKWGISRTERSEEHTSELQSRFDLVCRLLL